MVSASDFQTLGGATGSPGGAVVRRFGRFQLLGLIGRSERTMAWRVLEDGTPQPMLLVL